MTFDAITRRFGDNPSGGPRPDPDADAFADQDLTSYVTSSPRAAMAEIDKLLIRRDGMRRLIELAWHTVEKEGTYRPNWHIDAICDHLQGVSAGHIKRLGIAVPPRHMKSLTSAVMYPAYDWIDHPERRFLYASYAHNLSIRDSTRCRRVLQSPWYLERYGDRFKITSDQNTKIKFDNDRNGYRMATSVAGALTGEGGDIIVIDDALNAQDGNSEAALRELQLWWDESMSTRLNDPKSGAFVLVQQRLTTRDLLGLVLAREGKEYTMLCLPAEFEPDHPQRWFRDPRKEAGQLLWPGHMPRREIDQLKLKLGPYAAAAQLQQRPAPREGGVFKRSWFKIEKQIPGDAINYSRAWDFAATTAKVVKADPDWTATALICFSPSTGKFYVPSILRWREEPNVIRALVQSMAAADPRGAKQTIPKDPGQAGVDQAQGYVTLLAGFDVQAEPQSGDKVTRAMPFSAQAAAGNVVLIEGEWNETFLVEITSFPNGDHDDQVDAVASAFNRMTGGTTGIIDWYRQRLAGMNAQPQTPPPPGGTSVQQNSGSDFALALLGKKPAG